MYGLVNKAIKDLVVNNYGSDKWEEIARRSDFHDPEFVGLQSYDDALTYKLVGNASAVLGADAAAVLELFGEYWITYTADEGYGELMDLCGLVPMLFGLIRGLGKRFDLNCRVETLSSKSETQDYHLFLIRW